MTNTRAARLVMLLNQTPVRGNTRTTTTMTMAASSIQSRMFIGGSSSLAERGLVPFGKP